MPGRLRTASRPLRTLMVSASYSEVAGETFWRAGSAIRQLSLEQDRSGESGLDLARKRDLAQARRISYKILVRFDFFKASRGLFRRLAPLASGATFGALMRGFSPWEPDHAARFLPPQYAAQEAQNPRMVCVVPDDGPRARCRGAPRQGHRPRARHPLPRRLQHRWQDHLHRSAHAEDNELCWPRNRHRPLPDPARGSRKDAYRS